MQLLLLSEVTLTLGSKEMGCGPNRLFRQGKKGVGTQSTKEGPKTGETRKEKMKEKK